MSLSYDSSLEKASHGTEHLTFAWYDLGYTVKGDKQLVSSASGSVHSGEMIALMGPSGAGKSTLLDLLAGRKKGDGSITINGHTDFDMKKLSSFVEQDDALLGVLTVRETINFAAKLSAPLSLSSEELQHRVEETIATLGLHEVQGNIIGTPIQRGISGGQRRRVTLGSSMVSRPRILLADEPTSGLDSLAAREVVASMKRYAASNRAIVIASIHQPNYETLSLFDRVIYLAAGHTVFNGPPANLDRFLEENERPCPAHVNPSDYMMEMLNQDFASELPKLDVTRLAQQHSKEVATQTHQSPSSDLTMPSREHAFRRSLSTVSTLSHRLLVAYSRNILAYGIRLAMYLGMGFLVATIWVHLPKEALQDRLSVLFYAVAFLSFMSVAGVPSFLEERAVFVRERKNGLYGPLPFLIANSLIAAPFMLACSVGFTLIAYWAVPLRSGAGPFFKFLLTLFTTVYVAESQTVLVASLIPYFIPSLAIVAFINGLWMSVQGYFLRTPNLPRFWYYVFHWIDFETYSFGLLTTNELRNTVWPCTTLADGSCSCPFPSTLVQQCAIKGDDVLQSLGYGGINWAAWWGILVAILVAYRLLIFAALYIRRN